MKDRTRTLLVGVALISLVFLAAGDVLAKNTILFSGDMNANFAVFADWGVYTCPGGEASDLPYGPPGVGGTLTPCSPGSNFHMRGRELVFDIVVPSPVEATPLVEGGATLLVNWNWRQESTGGPAYYSGPMWGTFKIDLYAEAEAAWEGTMTGSFDGENGIGTWSFVGHGIGGDIDGMQIKMEYAGSVWGGPIQGRILRPGSAMK